MNLVNPLDCTTSRPLTRRTGLLAALLLAAPAMAAEPYLRGVEISKEGTAR